MTDDSTVVKFYGVFDGHGDFGKEVRSNDSNNCWNFIGIGIGQQWNRGAYQK